MENENSDSKDHKAAIDRYRVESEGPHLTRFVQSDKVMGGTSLVFGALTAALLRNMYVEFNQQLMTEVRRRIAAGEI